MYQPFGAKAADNLMTDTSSPSTSRHFGRNGPVWRLESIATCLKQLRCAVSVRLRSQTTCD